MFEQLFRVSLKFKPHNNRPQVETVKHNINQIMHHNMYTIIFIHILYLTKHILYSSIVARLKTSTVIPS